MKILVLSYQDSGGGCGRLARAIAEHPNHQAKAARWRKGRLGYDVGFNVIWQPDRRRTLRLISWCDAVIVSGPWRGLPKNVGDWGRTVIPPGAPRRKMIVNYRGTPYRQNRANYDQYDRERRVVQTGNFLDLLLFGNPKEWLPVPVWIEEFRKYRKRHRGETFLVAQAVTKRQRWHKKNTQQVVNQLKGVPGVKLDIIQGISNMDCLIRLGRTDLVVTAFRNGFGNAGLEAMAMGIPIVANGFLKLIKKYYEVVGYLPFVRCGPRKLRKRMLEIKDDPEFLREMSQKGCKYLEDFHSPRTIAEKAVELCQGAKVIKSY